MGSVIPPSNNLVNPLLTDLYQITMAYGYWKSHKHEEQAVFEVFFRKNPFKGSFTIFCGIDEVLSFIANYKFTESDIQYLKSTPSLRHCEPVFFDYLSKIDCSSVEVQSLQQGTLAYPRQPLLIISGPILICQLLETTILNLVNFPSLLTTNAARLVLAARGQFGTKNMINGKAPTCVEYGLRRAQGPDGGLSASKYCIVGGFDGTANVLAGKLYGVPILGTHAHAFVQSYMDLEEVKDLTLTVKNSGKEMNMYRLVLQKRKEICQTLKDDSYLKTNKGELAAYIAYATAFPAGFLSLVDTYNTLHSGIKNFIIVALSLHACGYTPIGIRLDSGDLGSLSMKCKKVFTDLAITLKKPFMNKLIVIASDSINEQKLYDLNESGHAISAFGIGTNLVTCQAQPALGCVFKLVEVKGVPRIKFSDDPVKTLIPGKKRFFRLFDEDGMPQMDLLTHTGEKEPKAGEETICYEAFHSLDEEPVVFKFAPSRVEELLNLFWDKKNGVQTKVTGLLDARESVKKQIEALHPDMVRPKDPIKYKVYISKVLLDKLDELKRSNVRLEKS